jgi:hypothetical protein
VIESSLLFVGLATIGLAAVNSRQAAYAACLIVVGSILYNSPWHGWGFHVWSKRLATASQMPLTLTNGAAWAMEDSFISVAVILLWMRHGKNWMLALWGVVIAEITVEVAYDICGNGIWRPCEIALDSLYLVSCAILWGVGGRSAIALLASYRINRRRRRYSIKANAIKGR